MASGSRIEALLRSILQNEDYVSVIIFSSTKENVKLLERHLKKEHTSIKAFHSDLEQAEREEIMRDFKAKKLRILIGTDILSRGIDVEGISLVLNYDAPPDPEDYIHRIGRTARASKAGVAITFVNQKDQSKLSRIEDHMGKEVPKMPLPEDLGERPAYEPVANRKLGFKKPANGKNFRRRDPKKPSGRPNQSRRD